MSKKSKKNSPFSVSWEGKEPTIEEWLWIDLLEEVLQMKLKAYNAFHYGPGNMETSRLS